MAGFSRAWRRRDGSAGGASGRGRGDDAPGGFADDFGAGPTAEKARIAAVVAVVTEPERLAGRHGAGADGAESGPGRAKLRRRVAPRERFAGEDGGGAFGARWWTEGGGRGRAGCGRRRRRRGPLLRRAARDAVDAREGGRGGGAEEDREGERARGGKAKRVGRAGGHRRPRRRPASAADRQPSSRGDASGGAVGGRRRAEGDARRVCLHPSHRPDAGGDAGRRDRARGTRP